jgi:hypothetical protein
MWVFDKVLLFVDIKTQVMMAKRKESPISFSDIGSTADLRSAGPA